MVDAFVGGALMNKNVEEVFSLLKIWRKTNINGRTKALAQKLGRYDVNFLDQISSLSPLSLSLSLKFVYLIVSLSLLSLVKHPPLSSLHLIANTTSFQEPLILPPSAAR